MGPSLNSMVVNPNINLPNDTNPTHLQRGLGWQTYILPLIHMVVNALLPILDHFDFMCGWITGVLFGPEITPVREFSGTDAVIISGASTGIGYDMAISLAKRGIIVFAGVRSQKDQERLSSLNVSTLIPVQLDVTSPPSVRAAKSVVSATLAQRGGQSQLVGIINNAGILASGVMDSVTRDDINRIFDVNVYGAIDFTQAFLPLIRQHRRGGRIVLIGSLAGKAHLAMTGVYSASKRAVEGMFASMQVELISEGIHVSIIRPGSVLTQLLTKLPKDTSPRGIRFSQILKDTAECVAISPSHVTRSVIHALTATYPLCNYVVGMDARLYSSVLSKLPDNLYNRLIAGCM